MLWSWKVLTYLHEQFQFTLIGGWAVYFWTRKLKSRDIDLCIDQDSFYRLQNQLLKENVLINRNPRLKRFESRLGDVEVDIYTPFQSNLIIPVKALLRNRWFTNIEGYDVAVPEVLLLLKSQAAKERWRSEKGLKDRIDLLSLLLYSDWKPGFLKDVAARYDATSESLNTLVRTVGESRIEYRHLGLSYERNGKKLRDALKFLERERAD